MLYDCAIVGTGPAGLAAALNLKIHHKSFVWIGSPQLSEKLVKAECISNYPGFTDISGLELANAFRAQAQSAGIEIKDHMVNSIMSFGGNFALMAGSDFYEARSVILTTGVVSKLAIPGESELLGRGVSYCATCDGNLYKGKKLCVICTSPRFEHEVRFLAEIASEVVLFPGYKVDGEFPGNVTVMKDAVTSVNGSARVDSVTTVKNGIIAVDGVFCLRDSIVLSNLLPGLEAEDGHIKVSRNMGTSIPGVFAAGDCTGRPYQYAKAVGEGNVASHSVIEYLDK